MCARFFTSTSTLAWLALETTNLTPALWFGVCTLGVDCGCKKCPWARWKASPPESAIMMTTNKIDQRPQCASIIVFTVTSTTTGILCFSLCPSLHHHFYQVSRLALNARISIFCSVLHLMARTPAHITTVSEQQQSNRLARNGRGHSAWLYLCVRTGDIPAADAAAVRGDRDLRFWILFINLFSAHAVLRYIFIYERLFTTEESNRLLVKMPRRHSDHFYCCLSARRL